MRVGRLGMIEITPEIALEESELAETFIRASGPGGQNVNKVATAVQLRFKVKGSPGLPQEVQERLLRLAGRRATAAGEIVIEAKRFRTREANRLDARTRLVRLVSRAAEKPKPRKKTRLPAAEKQKRLEQKKKRAEVKKLRGKVVD
jgi:ribosome-associated protein